MSDQSTATQRKSSKTFAIASAMTAGRNVYDNAPVFPKVVTPVDLSKTSSPHAFNSGNLAEAVNKLVGRPSFNVPAAGIMGILGTRTVANQGFAA
ncbi:MAG: hypothetical protein SPK50_01430 [Mobiluncus porci]|uniref:Uncharacterized protein n=1 Tax=Mobiluncus porci TaxID=2652278 RepID=A0A7K0K3Q3_9ACTO|nr:hypothetical protein [Mobiluncus porci]MDD7541300.1 hypothetical protein [Mobiluncus porci]MDY5747783.1 hypothetical protein [Mobiluncus porci]MST49665.1 hypothetical protein [Mobiluncus porci]